ncbi:hypothetical protein [Brevibacillus borstelensis]|uniref:hypothetical protein n=1 Tax=Brevibacillus borstelensis TaxID=45462 RepID=UPI0030BFBBB0
MTKRTSVSRSLCFALLLAVAFCLPGQTAVLAEEGQWDQRFQTQIGEWKNSIVGQDPQFANWRDARIDVQTLGANQHQWLVSLTQGSKQVGYMVVGEVPSTESKPTFVLLEYGLGEYILFDDTFAPREIAAEPVYDGFASHWLVSLPKEQQVVDAKTGERYLSTTRAEAPVIFSLQEQDLAVPGQKLVAARIIHAEEVNPFDNISWFAPLVQAQAPERAVTWEDLWQKKAEDITLAVSLYHSEVLSPFSVGSLHMWNENKSYIGVWDEGLRFLPYAYANKVGKFHIRKPASEKSSLSE